ncbi:MAG: hypothetical protein J6A29_01755, partial [Clostridia bacterium]|nr:hypothetical protein [Clostridia bacterium]
TGTYKVADGETGSGRDTTDPGYQEFTTGTGLQWRVWSIKENEEGDIEEVEIVLAGVGPTLTLQGADGYNHSVDILNDLCETLYSKTEKGIKVATGRSINVEDINSKTTYDYTTDTNYGKIATPSSKQYPKIYAAEIGSTANGLDETVDLLEGSERGGPGIVNASEVTEYSTYTGSTTASTSYATYTYYAYNAENYLDTSLGINTTPAGLIKLSSSYWLASRCVGALSDFEFFAVRCLLSSYGVSYDGLFNSRGRAYTPSYAVRPIVSLGSNVSLEYDSAKSTSSKTYWTAVFED